MLLNFYGKERLRFIYLVRDPRDVTLSFMKTPVGDCHPYPVAKKWAKLQNHALEILSDAPELVHQVRYEHVLNDKVGEVAKINEFLGCRGVCKTLRRGSVVVLADDEQLSKRALALISENILAKTFLTLINECVCIQRSQCP